ncbi:hypothetical protein [Erythrobacter sp.]|uniref:hypothetical protein n=1 Tax=Erythrobacter sp. TaxID=1042 RepID=UPI0025E91203|nr:hypothetical protein [Erythrobacter sp.]
MIRRGLLILASLAGLGIAFGSALIWNARRTLPFNSEGRYFDPETAVVVHQQSVDAYAMLAVAAGLVGMVAGLMARNR